MAQPLAVFNLIATNPTCRLTGSSSCFEVRRRGIVINSLRGERAHKLRESCQRRTVELDFILNGIQSIQFSSLATCGAIVLAGDDGRRRLSKSLRLFARLSVLIQGVSAVILDAVSHQDEVSYGP